MTSWNNNITGNAVQNKKRTFQPKTSCSFFIFAHRMFIAFSFIIPKAFIALFIVPQIKYERHF